MHWPVSEPATQKERGDDGGRKEDGGGGRTSFKGYVCLVKSTAE